MLTIGPFKQAINVIQFKENRLGNAGDKERCEKLIAKLPF